MFKHYILTRYNTQVVNNKLLYDDKDRAERWMAHRLPMWRECRESVLSQEGEFEWIISVDERTPDKYMKEIDCDPRITIVNCDIRDAFKGVTLDTPWIITSRLDNDDRYMVDHVREDGSHQPEFVKTVQKYFEPKRKVLDVRFLEHDYPGRNMHYGERRWAGSMFISLIESSDWVVTAFCRPHGMVAAEYPVEGNWKDGWGRLEIIPYQIIESELAVMVCHDNNIANKVRGKLKYTM